MAYEPQTWTDNAAIPASKLNAMEYGIADAAENADLAVEKSAEAVSIGEANGEDIARILDELETLRKDLNSKS